MVVSRRVDGPWTHQRAEYGAQHVPRLVGRVGSLVPGDGDHAVAAEYRGCLDLRNLLREEVVELTHAVVRAAGVMAVSAVVGDDDVEISDVPAAQRLVESSGVVGAGRSHRQVEVAARCRG